MTVMTLVMRWRVQLIAPWHSAVGELCNDVLITCHLHPPDSPPSPTPNNYPYTTHANFQLTIFQQINTLDAEAQKGTLQSIRIFQCACFSEIIHAIISRLCPNQFDIGGVRYLS